MSPLVRERRQGFNYHHDFQSVSGDYIIEQIGKELCNNLYALHQQENDIAFVQALDKGFPIKPEGTVYQMVIDDIKVGQFDLHWKTHSDGVRHYDSAVAGYIVKFKESKWPNSTSVEDAKAEFDDIPTPGTFYTDFYAALSEPQKSQLQRSH